MPYGSIGLGLTQQHNAAKQQAITQESLRQMAMQIAQADQGGLGGLARKALHAPASILGALTKVISAPHDFIMKYFVSPATGHGRTVTHGSQLFGEHNPLRGPLGFLVDVGADPLSYVSFGATGGASAAESALTRGVAENALRNAGEHALADAVKGGAKEAVAQAMTHPAVAERLAQVFPEGSRGLGSAVRRLTEAELENIPNKFRTGVKLHVPFTHLTTEPIISPARTAAAADELAQAARKTPLVGTALKGLSKFDRFAATREAGLPGLAYRMAVRNAEVGKRAGQLAGNELLQEAGRVFGTTGEGQSKFAQVLFHPETLDAVKGEWSPAEQDLADRFREFIAKQHENLKAVNPNVGHIENYDVRVPSEELLRAKRGAEVEGAMYKTPSLATAERSRVAPALTREEFARELETKHGVHPFEENPYKAFQRWNNSLQSQLSVRQWTQALRSQGHIKRFLEESPEGLSLDTLKKVAGFKNADQAVRAAQVAIRGGEEDARLARLAPHDRGILDAFALHAEQASKADAELKVGKSLEAQHALHGRRLGSLAAAQEKFRAIGLEATDARQRFEEAMKAGDTSYLPKRARAAISQVDAHVDDLVREHEALAAGGTAKRNLRSLEADIKASLDKRGALLRDAFDKERTKVERLEGRASLAQSKVPALAGKVAQNEAALNLGYERLGNLKEGLTSSGREWPAKRLGLEFQKTGVPEGWAQVPQNVRLAGVVGEYAPKPVVDEIVHAFSMERMPELPGLYTRFVNAFRKGVTVPFPAFWWKRGIGSWLVNYMGGVGFADEARAIGIVTHAVEGDAVVSQKLGMTVADLLKSAEDSGIVKGGRLPADLEDIIRPTAKPGLTSRIPGVKQYMKFGSDVLASVDMVHRLAAYLHALEASGGDEMTARMFTVVRHGDYNELSQFERRVMANIMPFYKWFRVKTPLVLHALLENPSKVLIPQRFNEDVIGNSDLTQKLEGQGLLPQGIREAGGVIAGGPLQGLFNALGAGGNPTMVNLGLPIYSLNQLAHPLEEVSPPLKFLVELVTNVQANPDGNPEPMRLMQPAHGVYALIARGMEKVPFLNRWVARSRTGDLRIDTKVLTALQSLPSSRLAGLTQAFEGGKPGGLDLLQSLTPLNNTPITPALQGALMRQQQDVLKQLISELYSRGEGDIYKAIEHPDNTGPRNVFGGPTKSTRPTTTSRNIYGG